MSEPDLLFGRRIRTSTGQKHFPVFIDSVEAAIDGVQELPPEILEGEHWQAAHAALWDAVDHPADPEKLAAADKALCAALGREEWLNEIKPS